MDGKVNITDDTLLDYIDGVLPVKEAQTIQEILNNNDDLQRRYKDLKQMDVHLQQLKLAEPSENFSTRVIIDLTRSIYEMDRKSRLNGLIVLLLGLFTVIIGAIFISQGLNDVSFNQYLDTTSFGDYMKLPIKELTLTFDLGAITQGLLFILVILSLLLLDRILLKPYFRNRRTHLNY